jgi:hypothetical protein
LFVSARVISLDPRDFIAWARGIARGVRADYRFTTGGQEELELEGTALEQLVICADRFDESRVRDGDDAAALFRAMASPWIRKACKREAERLRNGGLYRTAVRAQLTVVPLPVSREEGGLEITIPAKEVPEDAPEDVPGEVQEEESAPYPFVRNRVLPCVRVANLTTWRAYLEKRRGEGVRG